MIAVQKEVNEQLDGYDITIKNKNNSLFILQKNNVITWSLLNINTNYIIIGYEDYNIYNIFDTLYNNIKNCNFDKFKEFSYNEFINFLKIYKIINKSNDSIVIQNDSNILKIEKHNYFIKITFLGNQSINLSKQNLSFIHNFFSEHLNSLEKIDTNFTQISINEYMFKKLQKRRINR